VAHADGFGDRKILEAEPGTRYDYVCMEMHMNATTSQSIDSDLGCEVDCIHPGAVRAARLALVAAPAPERTAGLFAILGDPTRFRLLSALMPGELCVCDLAAATGVNRTTVSHQLRVLRDHRLVRRRREGKVIYYALDDDHVVALLAMANAHAAESTVPLQTRQSA
jgi:DNA-binding transcriptional ArsR family regulator